MAGAAAGGTLNGKREMPLGTSRFFMPVIQRGCRKGIFQRRLQEGHFCPDSGCKARLYHAAKLQPLTLYRGKNAAPTFVTAEIPIVGGAFFSTGCRRDIFVPIRAARP